MPRRTAIALLRYRIGVLAAVGFFASTPTRAAEPLGHLSPNDALHAFETEPGFTVELVAAEPLVIDPVALAFDEAGRLFVAENRDYPTGSPDGRPLGVIALLEDIDGDGRMDRRSEFATGLKFPNGVMCWRGGVIVTAAPDVWWLADTNGDRRADVKELLLTGFDTTSTSQLRANDPTLGPDGWIYVAGGLRGGTVSSPKRPGETVDTSKGDLRFKPDTGAMEIVAGKSQFGLAFDDAGNRFACMNRIQSQHAPLPLRYAARNPLMPPPGTLHNCPEIHDNTLMTRYTAGAARYFPISANITTADSHVGTYSAACAVHIYQGQVLPSEYQGAAWSCDPTGNLVRGDRLERTGGTFAARRIRDGTEALRSRDNWFRPVFLADGPDGALYIADMYRKTIEHPDYLPGEVRKHTDFEAGKDAGRVWRLRSSTASPIFRAGSRTVALRTNVADLVTSLSSTIPWQRDTAFRLLLEQPNRYAWQRLRRALTRETSGAAAVAILDLLQYFNSLDDASLRQGLRHAQPIARQNAVLLAERRLTEVRSLHDRVLALAHDPDPHVRHQVALTLGEIGGITIVPALAKIAANPETDRWTRAAILSSVPDRTPALLLLESIVSATNRADDGILLLAADLGRQLGAVTEISGTNATKVSLATAFDEVWRRINSAHPSRAIAAMTGFAAAGENRFTNLARDHAKTLEPLFGRARAQAIDSNASLDRRRQAAELLAFDADPEIDDTLSGLLLASQAPELQQAAVRALFRLERSTRLPPLLSGPRWNAFTPAVRNAILARLASRPELANLLLTALESGAVPTGVVMPAQRDQLRKLKDEGLRARAEKLFAAPGGDRAQALAQARSALQLKPIPRNGQAVFERACATCHRLNQIGVAVGPDLFDIRQQSKESILYHIVLPEAEIAPNFVNYECELADGRVVSGLLAAETASQITLRMAQGAEETIPRVQIAKLSASRLSLMPQEMEKTMTLQELADLLAYLRGEQ